MEVVLIALDAGAVDFHLNNVGIDAVDGGAESFVEHVANADNSPLLAKNARMGHPGTRSPEVPDTYLRSVGARCWL